jgi:3-oxoacyl-[acyl-carrier protein] reductase
MNRTALIGGASRGIGFACAAALARTGHRIVMIARGRDALHVSAQKIAADAGVPVHCIACDLSRSEGPAALRDGIAALGIDVDVLVNNVGGPRPGTVDQLQESDWEEGLDLLFRSTLRLYALVLPGMRARRFGRIINILSTTAIEPAPTLAISSVLRAGLAAHAKLTAISVAADGVTVNSLMPGALLTARTEQLEHDRAERESRSVEDIRAELEAALPMRRFLRLEELGRVVAFLASPDASAISGELLAVDGVQKRSI